MKNRASVRFRILGTLLASAVLAASCTSAAGNAGAGEATSNDNAKIEPGMVNIANTQRDPVSGGTLRISLYSSPQTLDPAKTYGTAAISGIPMAAIYGVLMRYNPATGEYEPKMAKSLEHNEDFTTWTLKLRKGVTFTDGTPLNAEAVVFHLKRIARIGRTTMAPIIEKMIAEYETPNPYTVVFHLSKAWSRFPAVLAGNGGMVVSPTAVREGGDEFGLHPVGAGPFKLKNFVPGEEIVLVRNRDYWDGTVHLDKVRFSHISGGTATAARFRNDEVQMAVVQHSPTIEKLVRDGVSGYLVYNHGTGWIANFNEGHPSAKRKVRRAVAYAMNIEQLNKRAANGTAPFHRTLFPKSSPWDSGPSPLGYDPQKARKLVKQVKRRTDWDGSLHLIALRTNNSAWREALTLKGQLNAVGFDVELEGVRNINQLIRSVFVKKDYDLAYWSLTVWNSAPWIALYSALHSESKRNVYGYDNPEFDRLLGQLRSAPTEKARQQALTQLQRLWSKDLPSILNKSSDLFTFWGKRVHGMVPTSLGVVLLDDAYLTK